MTYDGHEPSYTVIYLYRHMTSYTFGKSIYWYILSTAIRYRYINPYDRAWDMGSYTEYIEVYTFSEFLYWVYTGIYFSEKYMTVYDGIGIWRYMMLHDRHMPLYDKYSVLILVMATDVLGIRTLISGTCLLILPNSVPGCCCDWYMLAHPALLFSRLHPAGPPECGTFVAPERHAMSKTRQS